MSRPVRVILLCAAAIAAVALVSACGTEKISVPTSDPTVHSGAALFSERCAGCHTLSYAGTHGSATNPRSAEVTNGPNFNIRCERPVARVLYAIENGGFSGAIMPQNVVVGQDAIEVAQFVAKYAGRQAPKVPGQTPCQQLAVGAIPTPGTTPTTGSTTTTPGAQTPTSGKSKTVPTGKGGKGKSNPAAGTKTPAKTTSTSHP